MGSFIKNIKHTESFKKLLKSQVISNDLKKRHTSKSVDHVIANKADIGDHSTLVDKGKRGRSLETSKFLLSFLQPNKIQKF